MVMGSLLAAYSLLVNFGTFPLVWGPDSPLCILPYWTQIPYLRLSSSVP